MDTQTKDHIGRKISRIRELRGWKQEALAQALGVSQQTISSMENSEELDEKTLDKLAAALEISKEAIKNFSEEGMISYFNTFNDQSSGQVGNNYCTFNPIDKLVEVYEENKKLYERLLEAERALTKSEQNKVGYLERLLEK